jgi:putative transcriptional regulator
MAKARSTGFSGTDGRVFQINYMQNKIKELRIKLNITQEELADRAGVRRETIVFLEQGKYNPSLKLAHDVALALGTNVDKLFIYE